MSVPGDLGSPPVQAALGPVTTARLELRRFRPGDVDALAEVFARPEVWRYPYGRGFTREETASFVAAQIEHWETVGFGCWLAVHGATGATLGYVGLSVPTFLPEILPAVEVGWRLDPAAWGRGYATEGARAALDEAFDTLGLEQVCSIVETDNVASVRVAERLGLRLARNVVIPGNTRHGPLGALLFEVTRQEWRARRS